MHGSVVLLCCIAPHFDVFARPVLVHMHVQPRLELTRPPRRDLHSTNKRLRRKREPARLMHDGKFALCGEHKDEHAMRKAELQARGVQEHADLRLLWRLPLRIKRKGHAKWRVVQRERDRRAHRRRVHRHLARPVYLHFRTPEMPHCRGARQARAVQQTAAAPCCCCAVGGRGGRGGGENVYGYAEVPDALACEHAERLAVDRVAPPEDLVEMAREHRFFFA
jgi:hypothetical protein